MSRKRLFSQSKEQFVTPKVIQTVNLDLEDELLGQSKEFSSFMMATGHEEIVVDNIDSYWE
jgi:hypothetical protein